MKFSKWLLTIVTGAILWVSFLPHASLAAVYDGDASTPAASASATPASTAPATASKPQAALATNDVAFAEAVAQLVGCDAKLDYAKAQAEACLKLRGQNEDVLHQCETNYESLASTPGCNVLCKNFRDWDPVAKKCKGANAGAVPGKKDVRVDVCETSSGATLVNGKCICPANLVVNPNLDPVDAEGDATPVAVAGKVRHISCVTKVAAAIAEAKAREKQIAHICTLDLSNYGLTRDQKDSVLNDPGVDEDTKSMMRRLDGVTTLSYEDRCSNTQAALVYLLRRLQRMPTEQTLQEAHNNPTYAPGLDDADNIAQMYKYYLYLQKVIPDILKRIGALEKDMRQVKDQLNHLVMPNRIHFGVSAEPFLTLRQNPEADTYGFLGRANFKFFFTPRDGVDFSFGGGYGHSNTDRFMWDFSLAWVHNLNVPTKDESVLFSTLLGAEVNGGWLKEPWQDEMLGGGMFGFQICVDPVCFVPRLVVGPNRSALYRDMQIGNNPPVRQRALSGVTLGAEIFAPLEIRFR